MSLINEVILGEGPPFGKLEGKGGVVGEPRFPAKQRQPIKKPTTFVQSQRQPIIRDERPTIRFV